MSTLLLTPTQSIPALSFSPASSWSSRAFDHPTPTSFSQLQFLSSSVQSNDGADYTHRVPKVEENFCSGFNCCGLELDDLVRRLRRQIVKRAKLTSCVKCSIISLSTSKNATFCLAEA